MWNWLLILSSTLIEKCLHIYWIKYALTMIPVVFHIQLVFQLYIMFSNYLQHAWVFCISSWIQMEQIEAHFRAIAYANLQYQYPQKSSNHPYSFVQRAHQSTPERQSVCRCSSGLYFNWFEHAQTGSLAHEDHHCVFYIPNRYLSRIAL